MAKKQAGKAQARHNHNERKAAPGNTPTAEVANAEIVAAAPGAEATPALARGSVVDVVFDRLTDFATKGLSVAKRGLEASARWLDGQAKRAGDLAIKLRPPAGSDAPAAQAQSSG